MLTHLLRRRLGGWRSDRDTYDCVSPSRPVQEPPPLPSTITVRTAYYLLAYIAKRLTYSIKAIYADIGIFQELVIYLVTALDHSQGSRY